MVVNGRPLKRVKRRVTADVNDFLTFPSGDAPPSGPFRTGVRAFVAKHALLPPPSSLLPHLLTWQVLFRVGDLLDGPDSSPALVCLDVVEEDVARSRSVYCDQCRVVGWSSNPVCAKRYHFVIKADGGSIGGYNKSCAGCADTVHVSDSRCKSCNHVMTAEEAEDWMYNQLEDTSHLLHGVVHANGYGHLLRVNGREGGSRVLTGCRIMDFWDRLCKLLVVRKVSVMDVSKKYGLEFRLLNAVCKGHPWYGDWGYEFGAGSFALTHDEYKAAVETLSNLPLSIFLSHGRKPRMRLQDLIAFYQSLSENELVNIRDLFSFLMTLIHDARKFPLKADDSTCKKSLSYDSSVSCAWSSDEIARVEEAMLRVLRAVTGSTWVSWRTLRGAVCKAGPPELLDYCLKQLNGKQATEGMVISARCVPDSGAIEYRLEPGSVPPSGSPPCSSPLITKSPSADRLLQDLRYLYESMLHPQSMLNYGLQTKWDLVVESATKLLDCKQFVKDYNPENTLSNSNRFMVLSCEVDLMEQSEEKLVNPPPEVITISHNATISDLKHEALKAFQDVYLILRRFQVEELVGFGGVDESTQVKLLLGSTVVVRVRGRFLGKNALSRFRMERGVERWTVDCSCGAKDDDGERMLACDVCSVWQHTRCAGIPDSDAVPAKYVCHRHRCAKGHMTKTNCKVEIVGSVAGAAGGGLGNSLTNIA
ncbi:hypothetical protein RJ639_042246 [Escallonia herrerae]|uniref:Zinc finger PHD-type domain-containing protein n=1 Tax=Escallonia herrerae TaxID=1293975 RepID=A0AA88WK84_9ASTE|nr:hypothetical protein RJ639_042246 [Escallonia herrerae]